MFFKQKKITYLLSIIVLSIIFCFYSPQIVKAAGCCVHIGDFSGNNPAICSAVPPGKDGLTYCRELGSWPDKIYNYDSNDCEKISSCPQYVFTAEQKPEAKPEEQKKIVKPVLQIDIPGFGGFKETKSDEGTSWIGDYTIAIYKWSVSVIAILAVVMIMIAGFQWVLSRGNAPAISNAKARISGAFMGLIIILSISLFLGFINPNLTILRPLALRSVKYEPINGELSDSGIADQTSAGLYYKQCDTRWGSMAYTEDNNQKCNLCSSGCGATALAIVMASKGLPITPREVGNYAIEIGARKDCTGGTNVPLLAPKAAQKWRLKEETVKNFDKAMQYLDNGSWLVVSIRKLPVAGRCMTSKCGEGICFCGGHYIVLAGKNGNNINVIDPSRVGLTLITIDSLKEHLSRVEFYNLF